MIIAITGMPGSGKSFALVYRAYKELRKGRAVFANFPLKGAFQVNLDDLCSYQFPEGSALFIDEAGRWFNSRTWKDLPPEIFDLFTMHRHTRMDMYIGVQSFARIDKSLREVVELTYWARNHPLLPWHKYEGYYDLEKVGSMRRDYNVMFYIPKRKLYRNLYDTHAMKDKFSHLPPMYYKRWSFLPKTRRDVNAQKFRLMFKYIKTRFKRLKRKILAWGKK
ncbi:zonular occludens toxin domain-containing protein [Lysinibacillus xylanilyticus]|uniref:Zona occludens toxin N-terminal domain-containing protein n=2 Tax=Lysinibacillus xylanilyticus TaxID=582475 RepID=A0A2M9Q7W0_9BACI|nr:zonular occludens toxin domain-containing protein [Lysinibacillus xylanilyticus]PJO44102.1 hypothetical protein CWD94_08780 [Lysinibacillus xylanilyticus]PJO44133.1 hypothetical protein CWD94_08575 [Lysinibacillus xylanilyticus]